MTEQLIGLTAREQRFCRFFANVPWQFATDYENLLSEIATLPLCGIKFIKSHDTTHHVQRYRTKIPSPLAATVAAGRKDVMTRTIRMHLDTPRRADRDSDLNGYIFNDMTHARRWLTQSFVHQMPIRSLEVVDLGPTERCPHCKGDGFTQTVTRLNMRFTVAEFLAGDDGKIAS